MDLETRLRAAEEIARKVGQVLRRHAQTPWHEKAENDFVTEMDGYSERAIREALLSRFPGDEFYGEEGGGASSSRGRWIVDPIDGTQSFLRGQHGYTISIAYEHDGILEIGCVYAPDMDEMFTAIRGRGAFLNGAPIRVSPIDRLRSGIAHLGYGHRDPAVWDRTMPLIPTIFSKISDIRRYGSAAYALCTVAAGRSDIFFECGLHIYDIAAGIVILNEAGGRASGWSEDEDCRTTGSILATNGLLHGEMMALLGGRA